MPAFVALFVLASGLQLSPAAQEASVPVFTKAAADTFPESWQTEEINAKGEDLDPSELKRSIEAVRRAMRKYPDTVLGRELKRVFILKRIAFYGLDYGGTNSLDTVYLTNAGAESGWTDAYIEDAFHHEFSSILLRNHMSSFDLAGWRLANPVGFEYGAGGTEALRSGAASTAMDEALMAQGFISQYSKASYEEDFNMIAEELFGGRPWFWSWVDRSKPLREKVKRAIALYTALDPGFSEASFRKLAEPLLGND